MTSTAPAAPLVVVCGLDHANVAEEQDVLAKAGVRFAGGAGAHGGRVPRAVR